MTDARLGALREQLDDLTELTGRIAFAAAQLTREHAALRDRLAAAVQRYAVLEPGDVLRWMDEIAAAEGAVTDQLNAECATQTAAEMVGMSEREMQQFIRRIEP